MRTPGTPAVAAVTLGAAYPALVAAVLVEPAGLWQTVHNALSLQASVQREPRPSPSLPLKWSVGILFSPLPENTVSNQPASK